MDPSERTREDIIVERKISDWGEVRLTVEAPNYLALQGAARKGVYQALLKVKDATNKRMKGRMEREYLQRFGAIPIVGAFEEVSTLAAKSEVLLAGVINTDPIFPFVEYDTEPHMPPTYKDGPIDRWVERVGPTSSMTGKALSAYAVGLMIEERGTEGTGIATAIWQEEVRAWPNEVQQVLRPFIEGAGMGRPRIVGGSWLP